MNKLRFSKPRFVAYPLRCYRAVQPRLGDKLKTVGAVKRSASGTLPSGFPWKFSRTRYWTVAQRGGTGRSGVKGAASIPRLSPKDIGSAFEVSRRRDSFLMSKLVPCKVGDSPGIGTSQCRAARLRLCWKKSVPWWWNRRSTLCRLLCVGPISWL
jgi:hypothetical protein